MSGRPLPEWSQTDQVRVLVPVFAVGTAIIAAVADPSAGADLVVCGLAAAPSTFVAGWDPSGTRGPAGSAPAIQKPASADWN